MKTALQGTWKCYHTARGSQRNPPSFQGQTSSKTHVKPENLRAPLALTWGSPRGLSKLKLQIKSLSSTDTRVRTPGMHTVGTTGTVQLPVSPSKHHTPAKSPPVTAQVLLTVAAAWQKPETDRSCTPELGAPVTRSTPKSEHWQPTDTPTDRDSSSPSFPRRQPWVTA